MTVTPRFMTSAGVLLSTEYREQQFSNGQLYGLISVNRSNVGFENNEDPAPSGAGTSTPTGSGTSTTPIEPASTCWRVSDQTYLARFGSARRRSAPRSAGPISKASRMTGRSTSTPTCFSLLTPGLGDLRRSRSCCRWSTAIGNSIRILIGGIVRTRYDVLYIVREVGTQTRRLSLDAEWDRTLRDDNADPNFRSACAATPIRSTGSATCRTRIASAMLPPRRWHATDPFRCRSSFLTGRAFPQVG